MKEKISTILDSILQYDPTKLKRESGDFQFTDVATEIDLLYKFAKNLKRKEKEISKLVDTAKSSTADIALYEYLGIFKHEGESFAKKAYAWLFLCISLSIFILYSLYDANAKVYEEIIKLQTSQQVFG